MNAKAFKKALLKNDYLQSVSLGIELLQKKQFETFWCVCLIVLVEYTHTFFPNGPTIYLQTYERFYSLRKSLSSEMIQEIVTPLIELLAHTYKQHISLYVKSDWIPRKAYIKAQCKDLMYNLDELLNRAVKKDDYKIIDEKLNCYLQGTIGGILSVDCDSLHNCDDAYPELNLYTHSQSKVHTEIINTMFNVFLKHARDLNPLSTQNVRCLIKLYHKRLLLQEEKQSLIVLHILFYFTHVLDYSYRPRIQPRCVKSIRRRKSKKKQYPNMSAEVCKTIRDISRTDELEEDPFFENKIKEVFGIETEHSDPIQSLGIKPDKTFYDIETLIIPKTTNTSPPVEYRMIDSSQRSSKQNHFTFEIYRNGEH